jgi:hypothetical protein
MKITTKNKIKKTFITTIFIFTYINYSNSQERCEQYRDSFNYYYSNCEFIKANKIVEDIYRNCKNGSIDEGSTIKERMKNISIIYNLFNSVIKNEYNKKYKEAIDSIDKILKIDQYVECVKEKKKSLETLANSSMYRTTQPNKTSNDKINNTNITSYNKDSILVDKYLKTIKEMFLNYTHYLTEKECLNLFKLFDTIDHKSSKFESKLRSFWDISRDEFQFNFKKICLKCCLEKIEYNDINKKLSENDKKIDALHNTLSNTKEDSIWFNGAKDVSLLYKQRYDLLFEKFDYLTKKERIDNIDNRETLITDWFELIESMDIEKDKICKNKNEFCDRINKMVNEQKQIRDEYLKKFKNGK